MADAERRQADLWNRMHEIKDEALSTRATSFKGIKAKLQAAINPDEITDWEKEEKEDVLETEETILLSLWREDFKILAVNPFDVGLFEIGVYANDVHPIPSAYLNDLIRDLKRSLGEVDSAALSE